MKKSIVLLSFAFISLRVFSQEIIKHKEKVPVVLEKEMGIIYKSDTDSIAGEISFDRNEVLLHDGKETKYTAADIKGFALTKGKRKYFFSLSYPDKSAKPEFYENLTPKGTKLYIIKIAPRKMKKVETTPNDNPFADIHEPVHLHIYGIAEKKVVASDLKEMTEYMKVNCSGIGQAMEIKEPGMHFGAGASEEKRFDVYKNVIYQYEHDKCRPIHRY